jgi:hypothetical protein
MSFKNLCATLSSLTLQITEETDSRYKYFKELVSKLQHFEEFRNQVAHSSWGPSKDFNAQRATRIKTSARQHKGVKHHWEEIELKKISDEINQATKAQVELILLMSKIMGRSIPILGMDS